MYQGNRYYVIPKRVFGEEQMEAFISQMKAQLGEKYEDQSQRLQTFDMIENKVAIHRILMD